MNEFNFVHSYNKRMKTTKNSILSFFLIRSFELRNEISNQVHHLIIDGRVNSLEYSRTLFNLQHLSLAKRAQMSLSTFEI